VIPTIISQLANDKKDIKLGSLSPTRDFNYVSDTCEAFLEVARSKETIGKVVNSASKFEISIGEAAYLIAEVMQKEINLVSESIRIRPKNSEVNRLYGENNLIKDLTNWSPKFSGKDGFRKGILKTVDWFLKDSNTQFYKFNEYNI
jgi:nucleoside-diphosphate-sugar epimerase